MILSDIACICINDLENKYSDSYLSWIDTVLRITPYQKFFDVYISTVDIKAFYASPLNKFLDEMQQLGKIRNINPIQFNVSAGKLSHVQLMTFGNNFREVNQQLRGILNYSWYYQIDSHKTFTKEDIVSFKILDQNPKLNPELILFFNEFYNSPDDYILGYFSTGCEQRFSMLQNVIAYLTSKHNEKFFEGYDYHFYVKK